MSSGRERELKYRIPRHQDFLELRDGPRWGVRGAPQAQVNHYFDTGAGLLVGSRVLLRIRECEGRRVLTLKQGIEARPGFFDSLEDEAELTAAQAEAALRHPDSLWSLSVEPMAALHRRTGQVPLLALGSLANERVRREVDGHVLEVDRLEFPDGSEAHELEVETGDAAGAEAWLRSRLLAAGFVLEPETATKLERFLAWRRGCGAGPSPAVEVPRLPPGR